MTPYYSDIDTLLFLARTTARRLKERFAPGGVARVVSPEFVNRPVRPPVMWALRRRLHCSGYSTRGSPQALKNEERKNRRGLAEA